jgi:type VI secretion system secreted protein Hcp
MALNAYLSIVAQKQGPIRGSVTQKGREGKILVIGVMHEIVCPRDPASGLPTGKRIHKPFTLLKELDRSTPQLFSVLCHNENIPSFELQFWQPSPTGVERQHYSVRITNENITSIHF